MNGETRSDDMNITLLCYTLLHRDQPKGQTCPFYEFNTNKEIAAIQVLRLTKLFNSCESMGLAWPVFASSHLDATEVQTITMIGSVHYRRWRWNPFDSELDMVIMPDGRWQSSLRLEGPRLPEFTAAYSLRLVINHNPRRQLKAVALTEHTWQLQEFELGDEGHNVNFRIHADQELMFRFDPGSLQLEVLSGAGTESLEPVTSFSSYELNGFVWDDLDMFNKFKAKLPGRSFVRQGNDLWSLDVPLRHNGGIDFRADGVYQFLISAQGEEDYGFAAINDGKGTLVRGTGFSSSHGTSLHSACTVRVQHDGLYRFLLHDPEGKPRFTVEAVATAGEASDRSEDPKLLNSRFNLQLLGTVFGDAPFDPTKPGRQLQPTCHDGLLELEVDVKAGDHAINFAIDSELFLDTMGFGCWIDLPAPSGSKELHGLAWHGKPQEWNISFHLDQDSRLKVRYDSSKDRFSLSVIGPGLLRPTTHLRELSLVGSFESPMLPWDPAHPANLMQPIGGGRFERCLKLEAGTTYTYKYVANRSPWILVFADYELDGMGSDFAGRNPEPGNPGHSSLRHYGQLTTHGNPPPLEFTAINTGLHRFFADVVTGAYAVIPL